MAPVIARSPSVDGLSQAASLVYEIVVGQVKEGKLGIFWGNYEITIGPTNANLRVVPNHAPIQLRCILRGNFVKDIGFFAQGAKTMSKTYRDIKQVTLLPRKDFPDPSRISRGAAADIHRHVEDFASQRGHELRLRHGMLLVMHASENSPTRMRVIVLHKVIRNPIRGKNGSLVALHEQAALIFECLSFNQHHIRNIQPLKVES